MSPECWGITLMQVYGDEYKNPYHFNVEEWNDQSQVLFLPSATNGYSCPCLIPGSISISSTRSSGTILATENTRLTHWPLGDFTTVSNQQLLNSFNDKYLKYFLWNCYQVNATTPHWSLVNIGSSNGLVPSGNKPLPEPMLTSIPVAIWHQ